MYIINPLKHDERLAPGTTYVQATLEAYQRNHYLNPTIPFPFDLNIDVIAVVLDDHSPTYVVGERATYGPEFNLDTNDGLVRHLTPYVRTFGTS